MFEGVDYVHGSDSTVLREFRTITDEFIEKYKDDSPRFLVHQAWDALHPRTAGETSDSRVGNALDVISQNLWVALGASLSKALQSLSSARHDL